MLNHCVRRCAPFRTFVADALRRHPCAIESPWRIILYWDAVSPTDPLARGSDKRKIQCIYWTFREFMPYLWDELLWFEVAATRDLYVQQWPGKMPQFMSIVLEAAFLNDDSRLDRHGVMLDLSEAGDSSCIHTIWASHHCSIAGFKAFEEVFGANGPTGSKPCPLCRNILNHKHGMLRCLAAGSWNSLAWTLPSGRYTRTSPYGSPSS